MMAVEDREGGMIDRMGHAFVPMDHASEMPNFEQHPTSKDCSRTKKQASEESEEEAVDSHHPRPPAGSYTRYNDNSDRTWHSRENTRSTS